MAAAVLATILLFAWNCDVLLAEDCTTGFSVVAPDMAVPGKTTAVLVTVHGPSSLQPLNVTLRLLVYGEPQAPVVKQTTQEIKGHGILPLQVPADLSGTYVLQTLVNCTNPSGQEGCELQSVSQMRLVGPVRDVIIRPAKHAYSPGEKVSFWVLALDHDLQIAAGAIGVVSVKDPKGTKIAFWDQVALDDDVRSFQLPLSQFAHFGRWLIHVEVDSNEFTASIEVAPGASSARLDIAAAEEHYVELRFGREMRRRYKPGLPFAGKVEAMSTEKSVRVRVKVYDNTTSIYSQDIEISNGEGTFVVPAIMADSDIIALQAELVSVESKEIESHYVLAREPIHKWISSSDCYLLIDGVEHTLQPEEEAHVTILSTCPCDHDLHYVITTDGRVTDWAQKPYRDTISPTSSQVNGDVCKFKFNFSVRSIMAPVSQLLVYYITPQGEPVSDVISFDVKLLHRQVYITMEKREWWLPNQALDLEVFAESLSLVCLLGGRSGSGNDIRFDPRISEERFTATVTGEVDFLEAGVSFFQRQCTRRDTGMSAISYRQRGSGAGPARNRRRSPESLVGGTAFDQMWLWKCFNYTPEIASSGLTINGLEEAGKWSLWALTVSKTGGLRFSSPVIITVFRPLQAEFHLPSTMRVRETLEVDIKISNNMNSCMDITALLALSEGAQFLSNGLLYVSERLRLGPQGATSLVVRLLVTTPGLKNMTVEVNGYTSPTCEGAEGVTNSTLAGAVVRSGTMNILPEGIMKTDTESAYFCANENVIISTADNFKYEWMCAPRNHDGIIMEIKLGASLTPIHIALASTRSVDEKMYKITLGAADNTISWIGRGQHEYDVQLVSTATPGILSQDEWRTFWMSWEKGILAFGHGPTMHNRTLFKWKMDKRLKIQHIGFTSAWGSQAEFRIWNFNDESGFSQVLHLDTPKSVVPGSEAGELKIAGGLSLPTLAKASQTGSLADALSTISNLLALQYSGSKMNASLRQDAYDNLPGQIQTILSYRKEDNSFSDHQMLGSHRSTLQVLETLTKLQPHYGIDPELIRGVKKWVQLRQEDNGSFTPLYGDMRTRWDMTNTTLEDRVHITAETVITLFELGMDDDADAETIHKARAYLEGVLSHLQSPEVITSATLALVLSRSTAAATAIEKVRNISTTVDGDFGWLHTLPKRDAADWVSSNKSMKEPSTATMEEFQASLHALTTFCLMGDLKYAESVTRYLFYHSHILDTHREMLYPAVKAFNHYATLTRDMHRSLTISLATSGMELTDTLELKPDSLPIVLHLPSLPTKVFVYATGAGCATVTGKSTYSTYSARSITPLLDLYSAVVQEILPEKSSVEEIEGKSPMLRIKNCFKWKHVQPSNVLRLEVSLFSGFELTGAGPVLMEPLANIPEMEHGYNGNNLWFIFANVTSACPVCVQYTVQSAFVISSLRPAYAKVYPANREDLAAEAFFHTSEGSPLLKGITEDDLITWFGKNSTHNNEILNECVAKQTTTTPEDIKTSTESSAVLSTEKATLIKEEDLSVTTYTINVDKNSIKNLTKDRFLIEPTAVPINSNMSTRFPSPPSSTTLTAKSDEIILQGNKVDSDRLSSTPFVETESATPETLPEDKSSSVTVPNEKTVAIKANLIDSNELEKPLTDAKIMEIKINTTNEDSPASEVLVVDLNVQPPKHINHEKQVDIPEEFIDRTPSTEEPVATFAPEMKNDRYVLLDKEALWGMLREVVTDEMRKKGKYLSGERLRRQGIS